MGKQVVREQDGLRPLEVCVAGHDEVLVRLGSLEERALNLDQSVLHMLHCVPDKEVQVERNLVVAAPASMQLERHIAYDLAQPPLHGRVHVLVDQSPCKAPRLHLL
jgi:hypothetical protein